MMFLAFFAMAVLHFGGFVVLPLWLVFAPLVVWLIMIIAMGVLFVWARS